MKKTFIVLGLFTMFFAVVVCLSVREVRKQEFQQRKVVEQKYLERLNKNQQSESVAVKELKMQADETVNWQTYRNEVYGFEFKYPENYNLNESKKAEAINEVRITDENIFVVEVDMIKWNEHTIEEGTPATFYEKNSFNNWKYIVDKSNNLKTGNCDSDIIKHVPGPTVANLPEKCMVSKVDNYTRIETETNVIFYTNELEVTFNFSPVDNGDAKKIISTLKFFELEKNPI